MRKTAVWINRLLWMFIATVVVTLGAIASLGRHYINYVEDYQTQIVDEVSRRTGLHLEVKKIRARWVYVSPQFTLDGLRVFNPDKNDEAVITIDHLVVRVGLFQSLAHLSPVFNFVEGKKAVAEMDEMTPGKWQLRGFPRGQGSTEPLIDALLRIHRADIRDSIANLHFVGGRSAQLEAQSVQLHRSGRFRRLNLALRVADDGAPLNVIVEANGDPRAQRSFSAHAYAEFSKVDLTPILPIARSFGFDLTHGRIDGAAWLDIAAGGDLSMRGHLAVPTLDLAGITGRNMPAIKDVNMPFLFSDREGKQQLWLPRIRGEWGGENIDVQSMLIERNDNESMFTVSVPQLTLDDLHRVWNAGQILSEHLTTVLNDLAPHGELHNLQLQLPMAPEYLGQLRVRSEVANLKVAAWHGAPGLENINGFVDTGVSGGSVQLFGVNAALDFPTVYHQPIPFAHIRGALNWHREGERILVESGPIDGDSDAGTAAILLTLNLNIDPHDVVPPQMTLMVGMRDSASQYRDRFIPYTLQPSLLEWLGRSIGAAQLPRGGFIYRGSLRAGDHDHRSVQLFLDVENGNLAYHPSWPALQDLSADVWLDDVDLDVYGRSARIYDGVHLSAINVAMRPRAQPHTGEWLTVTGAVSAEGNDLLRVLRESPLQQRLNGALDSWQWQGHSSADLALGIPIGGEPIGGEAGVESEINVDTELGPGKMIFGDLNLTLDDVSGPLQYRSHPEVGEKRGLYSSGISGKLFERAAKIQLSTTEQNETDVRVSGKVAMDNLRDWLQQPLLDYAHGETAFNVALKLNGTDSVLHATSALTGVVLDLPPPYAKPAEMTLPFSLTMPLHGTRRMDMQLADWADLALLWRADVAADKNAADTNAKKTLNSAVLRLGQAGSTLPETGKLIVTGTVPAADFDPWRELLAGHRNKVSATAEASDSVADQALTTPVTIPINTAAANNNDVPGLALTLRDLNLPEIKIVGQTLRDVRVSGHHLDAVKIPGWLIQAQADKLDGDIFVPDASDQVVRLDLNTLHLPAPTPDAGPLANKGPNQPSTTAVKPTPTLMPKPSALAQIDPAKTIAADVHIKALWRGDENWGALGCRLRPVANGLRLDQLSGTIRGIELQQSTNKSADTTPAQITWLRRGDLHTTRFVGRLATDDIGNVLERWHFEKVMTSHNGFIDADVSWIGAPDEVGLKKLDGQASVKFNDGQFYKASGSASGALRVVGVFNFANLLRRLQLDFSDVFKGGISFDSIDGQLAMNNGIFKTSTPIDIASPSSRFRLSGQLDFNTEKTDMELVATLPVASNLPWMVALAGGLPAAAGVYVASKLFQEQVDHFSSAVYEIKGPWREPEVKFRRIFDDSLPQSQPQALPKDSESKPTAAQPEPLP